MTYVHAVPARRPVNVAIRERTHRAHVDEKTALIKPNGGLR